MHKIIDAKGAPIAIGPYSQGMIAGSMLYTAGQLPIDPVSNELIEGDIHDQVEQVMINLGNVLGEARAGFSDVVKVTVYLKDLNDFSGLNQVYAKFMGDHKPARACVEVSRLPLGALVEIDMIAITTLDSF